jgi:hypothetical protein
MCSSQGASIHLEGDGLPQNFCCMKRRKRADCLVCLDGRTEKVMELMSGGRKAPIHSTSETLTHYVADHGIRTNAILLNYLLVSLQKDTTYFIWKI